MGKNLVFLEITKADNLYVDDYLQHLYEPFSIKLMPTDRHRDLFAKLLNKYVDDTERLNAAQAFVSLNLSKLTDEQVNGLIIDGWDKPPTGEFKAFFDFQPVRSKSE